jgi:hypothetical protein
LIDRGFHRPALVEYTKISDVISRYAHLAIKGEISVDEALRSITREIRKIDPSTVSTEETNRDAI